jgi:DNA polymerase elongation subunit (family B)
VNLDQRGLDKVLAGEPLSIVLFDLECTHLSGMIGRILCGAFKPLGKKPYVLRGDDERFWRPGQDVADDRALALAIRDELESYDIIVGHNSKLFDVKFLDARLFKAGARPREPRIHIDTMWVVRSHLKTSSKLQYIQEFVGLEESKTPISWDDWARAGAFDKKGMDRVVEHCIQDVKVLEEVYVRLRPYIKKLTRG